MSVLSVKVGDIVKELLLAAATSADIFAAVLGLCASGIRLRPSAGAAAVMAGSVILWAAVCLSGVICSVIRIETALAVSKAVLFLLGLWAIFGDCIKRKLSRRGGLLSCAEILKAPAAADIDGSKSISPSEGLSLGIALSADSFFTGITAGMGGISPMKLLVFSMLAGAVSCILGIILGKRLFKGTKPDFPSGRISGLLLIIIAFGL